MSRISAVRSMTLTLTTPRAGAAGRASSSPSQITVSAPVATHDVAQLLGLARADVGRRVGLVAALHQAVEHLGAGGLGEQRQLAQRVLGVAQRCLGPDADQHDALEPQLAVLDLGDVFELGRQARRRGAAPGALRGRIGRRRNCRQTKASVAASTSSSANSSFAVLGSFVIACSNALAGRSSSLTSRPASPRWWPRRDRST